MMKMRRIVLGLLIAAGGIGEGCFQSERMAEISQQNPAVQMYVHHRGKLIDAKRGHGNERGIYIPTDIRDKYLDSQHLTNGGLERIQEDLDVFIKDDSSNSQLRDYTVAMNLRDTALFGGVPAGLIIAYSGLGRKRKESPPLRSL